MSVKSRKHSIDIVFLLLAVLIFTGSVFTVLVFGAGAYGGVRSMVEQGADEKLVFTYLSTKIRQADERGMLSAASFGGRDALRIREEFDGVLYETLIYESGGYLRELFFEASGTCTPEEAGFIPEDGQELMHSGTLALTKVRPNLLLIELQGAQGISRLYAGRRSEGLWSDG
jgi:hypothetical protein